MEISNRSHNKPLRLFPLKLTWEWKLATFMSTQTTTFSQFLRKATFIFHKMDSAIHFQIAFFILSELCYKKVSVNLLYNKPALDLACGINAIQSSVTLAAWRYPWRYCNASAFRLVLSIDGTLKHTEQKCQRAHTLNYCYILLITVSICGTKSNDILRAAVFHIERSCWNYYS